MGRDTHGRGTFLRNLPLAAHVGDIFFSHTGDTNGRSMRQLESEFERAVNEHGYRSLTQDDHDRSSLLGSSFWESRAAFRQNLRALNQGRPRADRVRILSYGHAPSALGRRITGKEFRPVIGVARHGRVINTDTGMSAHMRGVPHAVRFRLVDGETTSIQSIDGTGAAGEELLERR